MDTSRHSTYQGKEAAKQSIMSYLQARQSEAKGHVPPASSAFALALAMPHDYPAWRMPQVYTTTPSALAQPWSVDEQDFSSIQDQVGKCIGLPDGEMILAISRSPIYSRIQYWPNYTGSVVTYEGRFAYNPTILDGAYGGVAANPVGMIGSQFNVLNEEGPAGELNPGAAWDLNLAGFESSSTAKPHGDFLFCASHKGRRCFYMPAANINDIAQINFTFTNVNGTTGASEVMPVGGSLHFAVTMFSLSGEEWVETNSLELIMLQGTSTVGNLIQLRQPAGVSPGNYVAFTVKLNGSNLDQVTSYHVKTQVQIRFNTGTFSHVAVPNLYQKRDSVGAIRPVAAAGMLSPNSALYNRQGLVRGIQLPPGQSWLTVVRGGFNGLNTAEGMWNGPWEKGIYGFLKPVGVAEFEMISPFMRLSELGAYSPIVDVDYPLVPPGGTIVMYAKTDLQTLGSGSTLYAAGQCYTTNLRCLEFRTLDTWFKQDTPQLDQEELEIAMRMIAHLPQFHENFLHVAAITGFLRAAKYAGEMAFKHLPGIVKAIPMIGEAARKIRHTMHTQDPHVKPPTGPTVKATVKTNVPTVKATKVAVKVPTLAATAKKAKKKAKN